MRFFFKSIGFLYRIVIHSLAWHRNINKSHRNANITNSTLFFAELQSRLQNMKTKKRRITLNTISQHCIAWWLKLLFSHCLIGTLVHIHLRGTAQRDEICYINYSYFFFAFCWLHSHPFIRTYILLARKWSLIIPNQIKYKIRSQDSKKKKCIFSQELSIFCHTSSSTSTGLILVVKK